MEVRQLQIFRALAEELNFTRTAERVHTVQSDVTAQIKALEEELGVPLFDRLGRRVTLTDAGRRFQPFAEQALTAMEQGEKAICNEPSGPLRISAPESILTYRLRPLSFATSAANSPLSKSASARTSKTPSPSNSKPASSISSSTCVIVRQISRTSLCPSTPSEFSSWQSLTIRSRNVAP
jgi:hypothetical protein